MFLKFLKALARVHVPDADRGIVAARQKPRLLDVTFSVVYVISCHAVDPRLMTFVLLAVSRIEVVCANLRLARTRKEPVLMDVHRLDR